MHQIKVAMVYSSGAEVLNGKNPFKGEYYFFQHAIFRNRNLEVERLDALHKIDVSILEKDYDIVLLPQVDIASSMALTGIRACNIPVVAKGHDPPRRFET